MVAQRPRSSKSALYGVTERAKIFEIHKHRGKGADSRRLSLLITKPAAFHPRAAYRDTACCILNPQWALSASIVCPRMSPLKSSDVKLRTIYAQSTSMFLRRKTQADQTIRPASSPNRRDHEDIVPPPQASYPCIEAYKHPINKSPSILREIVKECTYSARENQVCGAGAAAGVCALDGAGACRRPLTLVCPSRLRSE